MRITVSIKVNSQSHDWLTRGVKQFGDDYRHKHQGNYYKIVGFKPAERGAFDLVLESLF